MSLQLHDEVLPNQNNVPIRQAANPHSTCKKQINRNIVTGSRRYSREGRFETQRSHSLTEHRWIMQMDFLKRVKLTGKLLARYAVQNQGKRPELFYSIIGSYVVSVGCLLVSLEMIKHRLLSQSKRSRAFFPVLSVLTLGSIGFQLLAFYQCYVLPQRLYIDKAQVLHYKEDARG